MRFKIKIVWYLSVLSFTGLFSQQKEIDSLNRILSQNISDSIKVDCLLATAAFYQSISMDSVLAYSKKAVKLSKTANEYRLADSYNNLGVCYFHTFKMDSASYCYEKALAAIKEPQDAFPKANIYSNMAIMYGHQNQNQKEIEYFLKAISLVENDDYEVCIIYYNLAESYFNSGFPDKGYEYLNKAYVASKKANYEIVFDYATSDLAFHHLEDNNLGRYQKFIKEVDSICTTTDNPTSCYSLNFLKGKYSSKQSDFRKAKEYFYRANALAKQLNLMDDILESTAMIAQTEHQLGNKNEASTQFKIFDKLYQSNPIPYLSRNYKLWSEHEASKGNFGSAYDIRVRWESLRDSILVKEKRQILIDSEKKYETEKKEREIAEQQVTITEQELSLAKKQRQVALWGGVGGILALLLGISFWVGKERQKRKEQEIANLKNQQEIVRLEALVSGEEKERVRLAQDLHDGINGDLSVIKFKVDSINRKKLTQTETKTVGSTLDMLDNAIDQVRRISHNLAPPSLQNFNLNEAIRQHLGKIQLAHQMDIDFQTFGQAPNFSTEQETALYRIVQELLNNIVKHAEATETLVQLNHTEEFSQLVIEDNGKGFDTKISQNGIGLQNIASRVAFLKGDLNIESSGEGSTFTITLSKANIT